MRYYVIASFLVTSKGIIGLSEFSIFFTLFRTFNNKIKLPFTTNFYIIYVIYFYMIYVIYGTLKDANMGLLTKYAIVMNEN